MSAATVYRGDIGLKEKAIAFPSSYAAGKYQRVSWVARLDGYLSTGEHVDLEREGATFSEALEALEAEIHGNGWEIE